MVNLPLLPIPEPLRGIDPGSFAEDTIKRRLPEIAERVLYGGDWPAETQSNLSQLIEDMPYGRIRHLLDIGAPDNASWEKYLAPYIGQTWLEPGWFLSETYFYRRILEATGYFQPGLGESLDPFNTHKKRGLEGVVTGLDTFLSQIKSFSDFPANDAERVCRTIQHSIRLNLWSNQADLSLWPGESGVQPSRPELESLSANLLVDMARDVSEYMFGLKPQKMRVDFILDNGGMELALDLGLADYFLAQLPEMRVLFHLKAHPTFVSDATVADVKAMIDFLSESRRLDKWNIAGRLQEHLQSGRLVLLDDFYWNSPLPGWEMTSSLNDDLSHSDLIICKGDANYRRFLGDRHWPFTSPLEEVLNYMPAPILLLRVLKSDTLIGIRQGLEQEMNTQDPLWLYNGNWGVIQFVQHLSTNNVLIA